MAMRASWNRKSRLALLMRLEMYISAELPIAEAFFQAGTGLPKRLGDSLSRARVRVESGQNVAQALAEETHMPPAVVGVLSCGASSGKLAEAFTASHALLEREDELIKKCLGAMTYPIVIGVAAVALTIGLTQGIMPQIIPLLTSLRTDLPMLTRIVMKVSQVMIHRGLYIGGGGAVFVIFAVMMYRKVGFVRSITQRSILGVPVLGSLVRRYALSLFFRSFAALVNAGIPAHSAYEQTSMTMSLLPLRKMFMDRTKAIARGELVSSAFGRGVPAYIVPLVAAGEASGNLGQSLSKAASLLDRELDHSLKRLTSLIEPLMMVGVGCMVGAIALSIMMPIYDISKTLQQ